MSIRNDFPIFANNPGLVYLDSASTAQKPQAVIDGMCHLMEHDYANIHRGAYGLSERSEALYHASKEAVVSLINARDTAEISYTYNATHSFNLLTLSLCKTGWLKKGDKVLLSMAEHHANIVPWLIVKEEIGIEVDFIHLDPDFGLDFEDFERKLTSDVRVVSISAASNVTGWVFDLARVRDIIRGKFPDSLTWWKNSPSPLVERVGVRSVDGWGPLFIVDGSQGVPHFRIDVRALDIDFLVFTGHKIMSDTGLGILYGKKSLLKALVPAFGGGGAINWVRQDCFAPAGLPYRFEPGTPHIIGAASLLHALRYIESIGWYEAIESIESALVAYTLEKWQTFKVDFPSVRLVGSEKSEGRIGVFGFTVTEIHLSDLADAFAEQNICVRAGHHCAEPLMSHLELAGSVRMSLFLYNTRDDVDRFFEVFASIIKN